MPTLNIASVQMDITLANIPANLDKIERLLAETSQGGAGLTIFPECSLTGYCFTSYDEARSVAEPVPGPITERLTAACRKHSTHIVVGMVELEGDRLFNVAVLIGPQGVVGCYRKVHLPYLGLDMFTTPGDRPFVVHDVNGVNVGLLICYDSSFPEAARCLAVQGADLIALPTNWPPGAECLAQMGIATRAMENAVYFTAANRVGTERGFTFIGQSTICAPDGSIVAMADNASEQILPSQVDTERSRKKWLVRVPGKHEIDRLADRRPEMYRPLVEPHSLLTPRQRHSS